MFVHELFSSVLPADFKGFLEASSSDEGIVAMGLLVSQGIMTSVPMAHYGQIRMMP
jgi:ribosomal protein L5